MKFIIHPKQATKLLYLRTKIFIQVKQLGYDPKSFPKTNLQQQELILGHCD